MVDQTVMFPVGLGEFEQGIVLEEHRDGLVTVVTEDGEVWKGGEWQLEGGC